VWSAGPRQPVSLTFGHNDVNKTSSSDNNIGENKRRVKFPCRLCEGSHQTHIFPCMDEASKLLEEIIFVQQQIPTSYHKFSPNSPLIDQEVDLIPSSIDPTVPLKSEVELVVLSPSSVHPALPLESEII